MDPVVHFEIPYEDGNRIAGFYETVFGWKTQFLGEEMEDYILVTTVDRNVKSDAPAGGIDGGFYPKNPDWPAQYPSMVIAVEDIHRSMQKVAEAGGAVLGEPMAIPGIGLYVSFLDSEGNRLSMLQPVSEM